MAHLNRWAKKMKLFIPSLIGLILTSALLAEEKPVLRLDVYVVEPVTPMLVHSFLTNVGDAPVTIPTKDYSEGFSSSYTAGKECGFGFYVGLGEVGRMKVVPSPYRHFPVTLMPGESTELPLIHIEQRLGARTVKITYSVQKEYADRYGWWSGDLTKVVVIGEGENPYYAPVENSGAGEITEKPEPNKPLQGTEGKVPSSSTKPEALRP